ncbi:hypothetical protein FA95DRAFT_1542600 [Auriscalpium vulgare]|uniref:Uncharacterized protein n=1 Tax=Auriscalpium vulgare TaxID=40419 RepID=A0ACB8RQZ0_9AGAM|nr:hypothetical protein FA95DRAFT_1542600 [Auriscalpium vulgare]
MSNHQQPVTSTFEQSISDIQLSKDFFLAAFSILLYDHVCTLALEIETFWKKRKTWFLYLFIFTRYYTPAAMTVVAFAFFSTSMTFERCRHWMYFLPIACTLGLMALSGVLMAIRVYALWNKNHIIFYGLLLYLAVEFAIGVWSTTLRGGKPFPFLLDNHQFHYCVFVAPTIAGRSSTYIFIFMDLAYNFGVFILTVSRTIYVHNIGRANASGRPNLLQSLVKDGAVYFGGIFAINFIWAMIILTGRVGLHALLAMPSSRMTVVLVSRITLNLRLVAHGRPRVEERTVDGIPMATIIAQRHHSKFPQTRPDDVESLSD